MTEVIGVRFKKVGKVYYFDPCGTKVKDDQPVIVETARGQEYGEVSMANSMVEDNKIVQPLKKLVRLATEADKKTMEQNLQFEKDAFRICEEKIQKHKLDMKLVSVEYTFDRSKILFYFSADGRVDFRELVKDLAGVFRTRIELRQIGVRDEAKMIGGLGICGRPLCCSAFLENFQPVSINMAKDQGLSLNPTKISGTCGRLMCCLKYENDTYQDLLRQTPPNESLVDTPYGRGTVIDTSLLRGTCRVRMQNSTDAPVTVPCDQCTVLRRGRDKGEHIDLPEPPVPQPLPKAEPAAEAEDTPVQQPAEHKGQRRDRRRPEGKGQNRQPAQKDAPKSEKSGKPRPQQEKPRGDKPKKEKPQQEAKPEADQQAARPEGERKRRHRGGRRNHRGGGGKPQAPKAE
ncbi:MAG: hypothetical protein IJA84_01155 [Clostridia bacterium]|nr:hypothetical protein [Clostridia bacterium]